VYALEPAAVLTAVRGLPGPAIAANPFFAATDVPVPFLLWVAAWIAIVLGTAVWSFRSREI
jgi:hypothetical protein